MMRMLILRAAILMLSESDNARLSAAVAAKISIPTYENMTLINVDLFASAKPCVRSKPACSLPHSEQSSKTAGNLVLLLPLLVDKLVALLEESIRSVPIWFHVCLSLYFFWIYLSTTYIVSQSARCNTRSAWLWIG